MNMYSIPGNQIPIRLENYGHPNIASKLNLHSAFVFQLFLCGLKLPIIITRCIYTANQFVFRPSILSQEKGGGGHRVESKQNKRETLTFGFLPMSSQAHMPNFNNKKFSKYIDSVPLHRIQNGAGFSTVHFGRQWCNLNILSLVLHLF